MQTEQKRETRETPEINAAREKKKGSAVLTRDMKPSFSFGIVLGTVFLAINLFVAAIYFHVINP